ncbi:unnamed protein product [Prunus armeniaca]
MLELRPNPLRNSRCLWTWKPNQYPSVVELQNSRGLFFSLKTKRVLLSPSPLLARQRQFNLRTT